jgi:xanthine dehydrogenase iron-sulfur cluster and FAD-binding subunit A
LVLTEWIAQQVPQCGYCQSGMITAVAALLARNAQPTDAQIDAEITNVCRCGTYERVRRAIHAVAAHVPRFMERGVDFGTFKLTQLLDCERRVRGDGDEIEESAAEADVSSGDRLSRCV